MRKYKYIILLLFLCYSGVWGQSLNKLSSFEGRNFYVAFMQNEVVYPGKVPPSNTLDLFISASMDAKVVVKSLGVTSDYTIKANSMQKVSFDREVVLDQSEVITSQSIHVSSDVPITIYGMNSIKQSSDMFSVIPVQNWGDEYIVMSYPNDIYRGYVDMPPEEANVPRKSQFCVVASYDATIVRITPKVITSSGKNAGVEFSVTLNKGETYLVQSSDVAVGGDLSGSIVRSNKPIACFSGHVRTGILQNLSYPWASKDHLVEMLTPVSAWGKQFITLPFEFSLQKQANLFRVTTATPLTTLAIKTQSGANLSYLLTNPGDILELPNLNEVAVWSASQPIQIVQYMRHSGGVNDNRNYDPSMSCVPPLEQFVPKILFQVPENAQGMPKQFLTHSAMMVVHKNALNNIRLDGQLLTSFTTIAENQITNTDYYWVRMPLTVGAHTFVADSGVFSGVLYGNGSEDSYSVVLGTSLLPLNLVDTTKPEASISVNCGSVTGYFREIPDTVSQSGLNFAYINKQLSYNYDYSITNQNDTSTYYYFSANVIDDTKEAYIELYARDRANNTTTVSNKFYPLLVQNSANSLDAGTIDWKSTPCFDFWIQNNSKIPQKVVSITSDNPKVIINAQKSLPTDIAVGDKLNYQICLKPNGDFANINANIRIAYECGKYFDIPVSAKVSATEVQALGYDYGSVNVGKDSCAYIVITNSGKDDIIVNGITIEQNSGQFDYNTAGIFPLTIRSGKADSIRVCFIPKVRGTFIDSVIVRFNNSQQIKVAMRGIGLKSELANLDYDFGNKRIGTSHQYEFTVTNSGNTDARMKYFSTEIDSEDFDISEFKATDVLIKPNYTHKFKVYFNPKTVGAKTLKAYYILDNDNNKKYSIELIGIGTLPTIETTNQFLGDAIIYTSLDKNIEIVKAGGNEQLSIASIKIIKNNANTIDFDLSSYQNIKLQPGDNIMLPVNFAPKYVGLHSVTLEVISDAAANYAKVSDTVVITAGSRPVDTTSYRFEVNTPSEVIACNEYLLHPVITNTGNVKITISSLEVDNTNTANGKWTKGLNVPIQIEPTESATFDYLITPSAHESGSIVFTASVLGQMERTFEYNFTAQTKQLKLNQLEKASYRPGDTVKVQLSGSFPNKNSIPVNANLHIETNQLAFRLIDGNYLIKINNNLENKEIYLDLVEKNNYIDIPLIDKEIINGEDVNWQVELLFRGYLSRDTINSMVVRFEADACYDSEVDSVTTSQIAVCLNALRPIVYAPMPEMKANYNANSDELDVEIENFTDEKCNIELYNSSGQIVHSINALELKKGVHELSIDMKQFSCGVYIIHINGIRLKSNKIFIKK